MEIQRITIPGHVYAANPSIIRDGISYLLTFDAFLTNEVAPDGIGICRLHENLYVDSISIIPVKKCNHQDARIIKIQDDIYIIYSSMVDNNYRMHVLEYNNSSIPVLLNSNRIGWERNWVPLNYNDHLYFVYSIVPHRILKYKSKEEYLTFPKIDWEYGEPRGGTPAIRSKDHYIAIFHSSKYIENILYYFIGAYIFENIPPFKILGISKTPITHPSFYDGPMYEMIKKNCRVIFPCGLILENGYFIISYGKADHELYLMRISVDCIYDDIEYI